MAGWQRYTRRTPRPQEDDRDNVDEDCNDDDDEDDNNDHRRAVETNAGKSDGAECYLSPFDNTTIWYVVAAIVEWPRGEELIFAGVLNVDLDRMGGR